MSLTLRPYRHHAVLYEGIEGFLDALVPFLQDGVDAGEPMLVVVGGEKIRRLTRALGRRADHVEFADMDTIGANPAHIIPRWREFIDRNAGVPIRGIGEPVHALRTSMELMECLQHEALLNVAIGEDTPLWLLCPYDASGLGPDAMRCAMRTHPTIVEAGVERPSGQYDAERLVEDVLDLPLPRVPVTARCLRAMLAEPESLRRELLAAGASVGLCQVRSADFALAAREAVAAAGEAGVVRLQVWNEDDRAVCEVADQGRVADPLVARRRPDAKVERPGLWLASQLCDLIQVRSSATGTVIRLHMRAGAAGALA